ncbi:cilia- and flagella-associated protein 91-like, partial [Anopheles cruzii]|uniref:cilia- and flagella-associated protein 91-like n=1 Tax=Anopheles cruzii TaxID=68878 RepID=UPI0022EC89FB
HAMQKLEATFERNLRKLDRKRSEKNQRYGSRMRGQGDVPQISLETLTGGRKKYSKQSYNYDPNLIEVGLAKLEKKTTIAHKFVDPRDQRPELWKPKEVCREFQKGFWSDNFLRKLYESLKQFRNRKDSERTVPQQCLIVVSSPTDSLIVSPLTALSPEKENDTLYLQAVLLQRLLRGRATQELIHRDYASEHDLMEDLIASHRLPVVEEFFPHSEVHGRVPGAGGSVRERYLHILRNEQLLDEFVESSSHAQMSSLMGTLERELTRLQNERNTQAFYMLAERERGRRESVSEEEPRTDRKSLGVGVGEEVDIYLENALLEQQQQGDNVEEWRERVHQLAREFDEEADRRSDSAPLDQVTDPGTGTVDGSGIIASSLADEMLLPDIFRRAARENIKFKQRPLLANVHELIYSRKDEDTDQEQPDVPLRPTVEVVSPTTEPPQLEERRVVKELLSGLIDRAVQPPESAYSENEVEELPEDEDEGVEGSDFFGLAEDGAEMYGGEFDAGAAEEEEVEQMANEMIEDILSRVLDVTD